MDWAQQQLNSLSEASLLRQIREVEAKGDASLQFGGKELIDFSSNDYLGLSQHPRVKEAFTEGVATWGAGSGASRLVSGSLAPNHELESLIAEKKGKPASRVFANGYCASVGVLGGLFGKEDVIILDKLSHASLIDGAKLSEATLRVFPHNNLEKLEKLLQTYQSHQGRVVIVTEAVYSMDGDLAPLAKIVQLKSQYGAMLLVDEAHALGVRGTWGLVDQLELTDGVDLHMGTLGKAVGVAGGYVACSREIAELIVNKSRSFIYSTAPPPGQAIAALAGLKVIDSTEGEQLREKLWRNIEYFAEAVNLSFQPQSAIIPWHVGDSEKALELFAQLQAAGVYTPAIRYPTVPRNTARLRITLSAMHTREQIDFLIHELSANT